MIAEYRHEGIDEFCGVVEMIREESFEGWRKEGWLSRRHWEVDLDLWFRANQVLSKRSIALRKVRKLIQTFAKTEME